MAQDVEDLVRGHRDAVTVKRVFGEPYQSNGVTLIPAARVLGGGGGGAGTAPGGEGEGWGTGFGIVARPAGVYVVRGEDVRWQPALDVNRMVAAAAALVALALLPRLRKR
ncbi:MAG: sporulation protein [Actinomycetota bacterium]|nr:sporulation protein [Actinomycetota bacterium]